MTSASAPAKIILFGEHAVVYGRPALAAPVTQVQATARAEFLTEKSGAMLEPAAATQIEAPDIGLAAPLSLLLEGTPPLPLAFAAQSVFAALNVTRLPARLLLRVTSSIPPASGLGSGAAVSVAILRALSAALGQPLPDERINALAYEIEKLYHGTPSGIDNTVITYARPVYFIRGQPIQTLQPARPLMLVIGDSGIRAPTRESVAAVRALWQADPPRWERLFDQVGEIACAAKNALESGQIARLGPLMNANHALLREMTVSHPHIERLIAAAIVAGAQGAKVSGGGRGGNMLALADPHSAPKIAAALRTAGAKNVIITCLAASRKD